MLASVTLRRSNLGKALVKKTKQNHKKLIALQTVSFTEAYFHSNKWDFWHHILNETSDK